MVNPNSGGVFGRTHVVFFEVDGVFTDGKTWQDQAGQWRRTFSVRDQMGLRALKKAGLRVCVLTSASSPEIRAHFENIGVDEFRDACVDTAAASLEVLRAYGLKFEHAVFVRENKMGGVELCIHGAPIYQASRLGGDGAVLEISNLILQQRASVSAGQDVAFSVSGDARASKVGEL